MGLTPATNKQVPDHSIMDAYNKQTYLGNQFIFSVGNQEITQTTQFPLLLLINPAVSASGFPSGYQGLFCNLQNIVCLTASQSVIARVYLNPTVSGAGTARTPLNLRPASSITSIASLAISPTTSSNGSLIGILAASAVQSDQSQFLSIIDPGQSLLITVQTTSTSTYIGASLGWYEL